MAERSRPSTRTPVASHVSGSFEEEPSLAKQCVVGKSRIAKDTKAKASCTAMISLSQHGKGHRCSVRRSPIGHVYEPLCRWLHGQ